MSKPIASGIAKNRVVAGRLFTDDIAAGPDFKAAAAVVMTELRHAKAAVEAGYISYEDYEIIDGPNGQQVACFRGLPPTFEQIKDFLWHVENEGFIGTILPESGVIALRKMTPSGP